MQQDDCNAIATLQKNMNKLFRAELGIYIYINIDDILVNYDISNSTSDSDLSCMLYFIT